MTDTDDPRELGGDISGPGGPFDSGGVVIDGSRAIIVDYQQVALIDPEKGARGQLAFALLLEGRINQTEERAKVMCFESLDGLAALVTEVQGVVNRAGVSSEFTLACNERWREMPHE